MKKVLIFSLFVMFLFNCKKIKPIDNTNSANRLNSSEVKKDTPKIKIDSIKDISATFNYSKLSFEDLLKVYKTQKFNQKYILKVFGSKHEITKKEFLLYTEDF